RHRDRPTECAAWSRHSFPPGPCSSGPAVPMRPAALGCAAERYKTKTNRDEGMRSGFHGDTLTHRGREFALIDQPLEAYFELIGSRPDFDSGNGRGYAAHWIIEDGWLYLDRLTGRWAKSAPLSMNHMFPFAGTKVYAAWLSA